MHEHDGKHTSGMKVVDRRRFTASGEIRPDAEADDVRIKPKPAVVADAQPAAANQAPAETHGVQFMSFIASLATTAMAALGVLPPEQSRGIPVDYHLAREYIEIIAMLKDRTKGNLNAEEQQSMQRLLTELRLQFVELTQGPSAVNSINPPFDLKKQR